MLSNVEDPTTRPTPRRRRSLRGVTDLHPAGGYTREKRDAYIAAYEKAAWRKKPCAPMRDGLRGIEVCSTHGRAIMLADGVCSEFRDLPKAKRYDDR